MEFSSMAWQSSELNVLDFLFDKHNSFTLPGDADSFDDLDIKSPSLINLDSWDDLDDAFSMFLSDGSEATAPSLSPPFYNKVSNSPPTGTDTYIPILEDKIKTAPCNITPETGRIWSLPENISLYTDFSTAVSPPLFNTDHVYSALQNTATNSFGGRAIEDTTVVDITDYSDTALNVEDICADVEVSTTESDVIQTHPDEDVLPFTVQDITTYSPSSSPGSSSGSGSSGSCRTSYPELKLTPEEKRLLNDEGVILPTNYPLTKEEEKVLKLVRRKIRNKKSALVSRNKKKEYVSGLEDRVKTCTAESNELRKKVTVLETHNRSLLSELRKLQAMFSEVTATPTQARTCVMVLVLSFAFLLVPSLTTFSNPPLPGGSSIPPSNSLGVGSKIGSSVPCTSVGCLLPGSKRNLLQSKAIPDSPIPTKITKKENTTLFLETDQDTSELHHQTARRSTENLTPSERKGSSVDTTQGFRKLTSDSSDPDDDPYPILGSEKDDNQIRSSLTSVRANMSKFEVDDTQKYVTLPQGVI